MRSIFDLSSLQNVAQSYLRGLTFFPADFVNVNTGMAMWLSGCPYSREEELDLMKFAQSFPDKVRIRDSDPYLPLQGCLVRYFQKLPSSNETKRLTPGTLPLRQHFQH